LGGIATSVWPQTWSLSTPHGIFDDADHRAKFDNKLKKAGFSASAVGGEAMVLALPSLKEIDRMRKSARQERDAALKQLDLVYDARPPDQQMPISMAASRTFLLMVKRDKELVREERQLARAREAIDDGNP
jgi:hypothetical protein